MNKKSVRIISIILITVMIIGNLFTIVSAKTSISEITDNFDKYAEIKETDNALITHKAGVILGYIQIIGAVLSVIILVVLGIKFMLGSVEEKASYKESLKPYIIGVVILFAGSVIPKIIFDFFNK